MKQVRIVVVTGLSGAGKSTALHAFEDLGHFCIDNLPPVLLPKFVELCDQPHAEVSRVCVGMDIREKHFLDEMLPVLDDLRRRGFEVESLYLEATEEVLLSRFKETRRTHPLGASHLPREGIAAERERLAPARARADRTLDTTQMRSQDLRQWVLDSYGGGRDARDMVVSLISFGYRSGLPPEADLIVDVRFLPNPYFVEGLRSKDGRDDSVYRYVIENQAAQAFLGHWEPLLEYLLPAYAAEGKAYLTIAFGCTGGQHRSVALARWAEQWLLERGYALRLIHRDLPRG